MPDENDQRKPIEHWLQVKLDEIGRRTGLPEKTDPAREELRLWFAVARTKPIMGWAVGEPVTEEQFDAGIEKAKNHNPHTHALSLAPKREG